MPTHKKRKSDFTVGLENILNNPSVSPFHTNPAVFKEMTKASGLSMSDMMRYVGKKTKGMSQKKMDEKRSESRLEKLEADSA